MVGGSFMMTNGFGDDDNTTNNMFYGDVFDKIEDLLDFSNEEMQMLMEPELLSFEDSPVAASAPPPPPPPPPLPLNDSSFPPVANVSAGAGTAVGLQATDDETFPCDDLDVAELEWLSNFVEESFSPTSIDIPQSNNNNNSCISNSDNGVVTIISEGRKKVESFHYRTPSPVSVLEHNGHVVGGRSVGASFSSTSSSSPTSSSSCSSVGTGIKMLAPFSPPETIVAHGRAPRTKRPRLPRSGALLPFEPPSLKDNVEDSLLLIPNMNADLENFAESNPILDDPQAQRVPNTAPKKYKKLKIISSASAAANSQPQAATPVRKCMHCEIQKTPQWRAGPMGPKTLCNACGVRYKSGRLFPEYRPAASPTFVASQHSNSHKKVIEMRVKSSQEEEAVAAALPVSVKACELFNYIKSS